MASASLPDRLNSGITTMTTTSKHASASPRITLPEALTLSPSGSSSLDFTSSLPKTTTPARPPARITSGCIHTTATRLNTTSAAMASIISGHRGQRPLRIPMRATVTTAIAANLSPCSQPAPNQSWMLPIPAAKAIITSADGNVKPSQAAKPPAQPARS